MKIDNYRMAFSIILATLFAFILSIFFSFFQDVFYSLELVRVSNNFIPFGVYDKSFFLTFIFSFLSSILGLMYGLQNYFSKNLSTINNRKNKAAYQIQFMCWVLLLVIARFSWWYGLYSNTIIRLQDLVQLENLLFSLGCLFLVFIVVFSVNQVYVSIYNIKTKTTLLFIFGITLFSFGVSSIETINRRDLEKIALKNHPYFQNTFELPKSHNKKSINRRKTNDIFDFALIKHPQNKKVEFYYKNTLYPLSELQDLLYSIQPRCSFIGSKHILHVEKNIKLKEVIPYLYTFYSLHLYNVGFQIQTKYLNQPSIFSFKLHQGMFYDFEQNNPNLISHKDSVCLTFPTHFNNYIKNRAKTQLFFSQNGILFNDSILSKSQLNKLVEQTFSSPDNHEWKIEIINDYSQDFQSYISNKSLIFNSITELRETYAEYKYGTSYQRLNKFQQRKISVKFPISIYEIGLDNIDKSPFKLTK